MLGCADRGGWLSPSAGVYCWSVPGVGLARVGVAVVGVDRPNRQMRHRKGKSDPVDAVAAARAALSGQATGLPKTRDGNVEAIRVLGIARRSKVDTRIETLNQLRHVVFTATPEIRTKFTGLTAISLANRAASLRPRQGDDPVRYTTLVTIRALGQRVHYLREETKRLNRLLRPLIREHKTVCADRSRRAPRSACSGAEHIDDRTRAYTPLGEKDEQVVDQVCAFLRQPGIRTARRLVPRREQHFGRLFGHLASCVSTPPSSSDVVYDPSGRSSARAAMTCHRRSSQAKPWSSVWSEKHVSAPVWHVGPDGTASMRRASPSQSGRIDTNASVLCDVSPFRHSSLRDRLQNVTRPVSLVRAMLCSLR